MGKIAFVFAGQGAQYPGMGLALYEQIPAAASVFEKAEALRPGTMEQCFRADADILNETKNTQPCMFAMEMACAAALSQNGIHADMAAGFSLGELSALAYAGAADFETMFRLVCRRGELMQEAASLASASMAAVVRLSAEQVTDICSRFTNVYPVNFNCPGQTSVSGAAEEMPTFFEAVKAAGGRSIPLKVKGGFHSPFMKTAAAAFEETLAGASLALPALPVYANRTGAVYAEPVAELLAKQIVSQVQWETTIRNMIADGADTFLELGPGKTLCGMIKRIDPTVNAYPVSDPGELAAVYGGQDGKR